MINLCTNFEVSISIGYEDIKDDEKSRQVAQLSLTNPRNALHNERQNFKTVTRP